MAKTKTATATTNTGIDPAEIARRVDAVLGEPLYWFPVRHHSPTTARHLRAAINARKPKIVFIEGPFEANDLIPHITDAGTAPPVAIYSSYRDDNNVLGLNGIESCRTGHPRTIRRVVSDDAVFAGIHRDEGRCCDQGGCGIH